jgi:hypothetical protein
LVEAEDEDVRGWECRLELGGGAGGAPGGVADGLVDGVGCRCRDVIELDGVPWEVDSDVDTDDGVRSKLALVVS